MGKFDYFERPPAEPACMDCEDRGFVWRVPDGFNPFAAGGFNTANAMFKHPCRCRARMGSGNGEALSTLPVHIDPSQTKQD